MRFSGNQRGEETLAAIICSALRRLHLQEKGEGSCPVFTQEVGKKKIAAKEERVV